jgi:hypothetical protein
MRRAIRAGLFILVFSFSLFGQKVIENPEKPLNKNAGRILKIKEALRITDADDRFYFKGPYRLKVAADSTILFIDHGRLLKFSKEGQFKKSLSHRGEGPGEIKSSHFTYNIGKNEIYIYDPMSWRLIIMDFEGDLKKEITLEKDVGFTFLGKTPEGFYFFKNYPPHERKKSRLYDMRNVVYFVSEDGKKVQEVYKFFNKQFFIAASKGGGGMSWDSAQLALDNGKLYFSPGGEYFISFLDLKNRRVLRSFKRKYRRVKHVLKDWEKDFSRKYGAPKRKYEQDIASFYIHKNMLWVQTSTVDKQKGILFDVFNEKGQYIDNFFLDIKGRILEINENNIYVCEEDNQGNYNIVKYAVMESISRY